MAAEGCEAGSREGPGGAGARPGHGLGSLRFRGLGLNGLRAPGLELTEATPLPRPGHAQAPIKLLPEVPSRFISSPVGGGPVESRVPGSSAVSRVSAASSGLLISTPPGPAPPGKQVALSGGAAL